MNGRLGVRPSPFCAIPRTPSQQRAPSGTQRWKHGRSLLNSQMADCGGWGGGERTGQSCARSPLAPAAVLPASGRQLWARSFSASRGLAPVARPRVTTPCTKVCHPASEKSLKARLRALGSQGPKSRVVLGPPWWKSWRPALWHGPCAGDTTMAVASTAARNWACGREGWSPQYCLRDGKRSFGCPWHGAVPRTKALRVCYGTAKAVKGGGEIMSNN